MQLNRRGFMAAGGAGLLAARFPGSLEGKSVEGIKAGELTKASIPTPALLLDMEAFESNLRAMAAHCRQAGCQFRPHAKTHKCAEIAKRQLASGAIGICVATVAEAEAMAAAGVTGLLLTSPIVDSGKVARIIKLNSPGNRVMVSVGHGRQVELLAAAAQAAKTELDLLIDLDVGDRRTGIPAGEPAMELARFIAKQASLRLRGIQAYAGSASHVEGYEARRKYSIDVMNKAAGTREALVKGGFDAAIFSGGSTGTYNIDTAVPGFTELQAGSYVFMDVDYRRIGGKDGAVYRDFQPSLTVLATVVSASHADRVTIDAGTKALDTTTSHRPQAKGQPGLIYNRGGDEFGFLTSESAASLPGIGQRIEFVVPHCDPTANLYDRLYVARGDKIEAVWPLVARRETG